MGELGDLPGQTAALARETLLDQVLPPLMTNLPWAGPLLG